MCTNLWFLLYSGRQNHFWICGLNSSQPNRHSGTRSILDMMLLVTVVLSELFLWGIVSLSLLRSNQADRKLKLFCIVCPPTDVAMSGVVTMAIYRSLPIALHHCWEANFLLCCFFSSPWGFSLPLHLAYGTVSRVPHFNEIGWEDNFHPLLSLFEFPDSG